MSKNGSNWVYISIAYTSLLAVGLLDNTRGPYFDSLMAAFRLNDEWGAMIFVVPSSVAFIASLGAQKLIIKWNNLNCLRLGLLLLGAGFVCMSYSRSFFQLMLSCVLFGLGFGVTIVAQNQAVEEASPEGLRRKLFSGLHSTYALAALAAPLLAQFFAKVGWNWRTAFFYAAIFPWAVIFASAFVNLKKRPLVKQPMSLQLKVTARHRWHFILLSTFLACYVVSEVGLSSRLVLYLMRTERLSMAAASSYLAWFFALLFMGRLLFSLFHFGRWKSEKVMLFSVLTSVAVFVYGLSGQPYALSVLGLTMAPFFPLTMDYLSHRFGSLTPMALSYAMGITNLFIVIMHYGVGYFTEGFGIRVAMWFAPICLGFSAVLLLVERRFQET